MKEKRLYSLILLSLVLATLDTIEVGLGEEHSYLVFKDDFENLNADRWRMQPTDPDNQGYWSVVLDEGTNVLSLEGNIDAQIMGVSLSNYTIQVKTKFVVYDQAGHLSLRITDPTPRYFVRFDGKDIRLVKNVDSAVDLEVVECLLDPDTWYTIKVVCDGDEINVYVDETLYIDHVDAENPLLSGGIGLESGVESHLYFDDVMVYSTHDVYVRFLLERVEDEINHARADGYDTSRAEDKLDEAYEAFDEKEFSLSEALANEAQSIIYLEKDETSDSGGDGSPFFSINWSIQTITGLITIGAAFVGAVSWMYRRRLQGRKGRILIKKLLEEVDDVYSRFKMNAIKCESELIRLKSEILREFKEGIIDEENFELLDSRIEDYLNEIREEIEKKNS